MIFGGLLSGLWESLSRFISRFTYSAGKWRSNPHRNRWEALREDPDRAAFEGWRQHWLQLWGFIGQQHLNKTRDRKLSEAICFLTMEKMDPATFALHEEKNQKTVDSGS